MMAKRTKSVTTIMATPSPSQTVDQSQREAAVARRVLQRLNDGRLPGGFLPRARRVLLMLMPVPVSVVVAPATIPLHWPNVQPEPRASLSIIRRILLARLLGAAAAVVVTMRAIRTASALPVGAASVPPLHRTAPSLIGTSTVIPPFQDPRCHPAKRTCRRPMLRSVAAGRSGCPSYPR